MFGRGAYLTSRAHRIALLIGIVSIAIAVWGAVARSWLCDDAFISFRYAENFVRGSGLVFNPNERVEGYTNFLWTIWIALGLTLGVNAETWAIAWGIVFYAATIVLLLLYHFRVKESLGQTRWTLPVAALLGALHTDWMIYATSGLETSLLTFLVVAGYLVLVNSKTKGSLLRSGLLFALASLTRPDAVLFASVAFIFVLVVMRPSIRSAFFFSIPIISILVPFLTWRLSYYGDIFPNTYYAKSGNVAWYSQGWFYFWLYFQKYWVLFFGIIFVLPALFLNQSRIRRDAALAMAFTIVYSFYVIRVGGDFMFARLLIPITPFLLILLELGLIRFLAVPAVAYVGVVAGLCLAMMFNAERMSGPGGIKGITNEWFYYRNVYPNWASESKQKAEILNRYFDGLPVRLAYFGGEARLMYYLRPFVAIECETGLTDSFIAHLPLKKRGRIGHEKKAPPDYLILQRKLHFSFAPHAAETLKLNEAIPNVEIQFDGIRGRVLHWDPDIMSALLARGAKFVDFPQALDQYIKHIREIPKEKVLRDFRKLQLFYFSFVNDLERRRAFETALSH